MQSGNFLLHASSAYLNVERAKLLCTLLLAVWWEDGCLHLTGSVLELFCVLGGNPGPVDKAQQTSP